MIFSQPNHETDIFYLENTFIDFKNLFKFAINHFIHQDTENCLNIFLGNIPKETLFSWFSHTKTSTRTFLVAKKKCKTVRRKLKKHPLIEKTQYINNFLTKEGIY